MLGKEIIKSHLPNISTLSGIYRMLDKNKNIIYIGKAKNLQNRLSQYTLKLEGKNKIMISLLCHLEYSITESESSALILEAQLIKKFKPKFNILLKDDKSFPYIKLRLDHQYPQLLKYRGKDFTAGDFFGPFASATHVNVTIAELQKIFKLRSCSDSYFANRTRPCLQYQIKRCCAPCTNKISFAEYAALVLEVKTFLSGGNQKLQNMLADKMKKLSDGMQFEQAAEIRDKIKALSYVQLKSGNIPNLRNVDILALATHNGEFCIQLFMYRSYQACGNQCYFPMQITGDDSISDVIGTFIMQLYQKKSPAEEILLSHDLENTIIYIEALKKLHSKNVKISMPKLGMKRNIIQNAVQNAEIALNRQLKISAKNSTALSEIQKIFDLKNLPKRIEIYDNSHIQGAFPVGAMVVAGIDGFDKKEYRLFNIKETDQSMHGGDDYAMLHEVLTRRFKRLKSEPFRTPDLMIIDGGKAHMNIVSEVMQKLQINLPFICMSKGVDRNSGREQFHRPLHKVFTLDKNLDVMKYLQVLRDEAHNFAIKSHRNKRSIAIKTSSLDSIAGIGAAKKTILLNYFGSFKTISDATITELATVKGISKELTTLIYESLHV